MKKGKIIDPAFCDETNLGGVTMADVLRTEMHRVDKAWEKLRAVLADNTQWGYSDEDRLQTAQDDLRHSIGDVRRIRDAWLSLVGHN